MNTISINNSGVTVTFDNGDKVTVRSDSAHFERARLLAIQNDFAAYRDLALQPEPTPEPAPVNIEGPLGVVVIEAGTLDEAREKFDAMMGMTSIPATNHSNDIYNNIPQEESFCDDCGEEIDECICDDVDDLDEHDLRNWNGSPIYYLTKEQATEQVVGSMGFWAYHDFGITARHGRRYATVPTGFGPSAPEGYEWACVSIES